VKCRLFGALYMGGAASRPYGRAYLVPALRAWFEMDPGAKRRHLIEYVSRVIFDSMPFEEFNEFFLKIPPFMMLFLIANIFNDIALGRLAYAKCCVSFLP